MRVTPVLPLLLALLPAFASARGEGPARAQDPVPHRESLEEFLKRLRELRDGRLQTLSGGVEALLHNMETDATAPLSVYGRTKRDGELAIAASGARHLIFRTSWVHAPGGNNFIAKILKRAAEQDELKVIDDQIGAPTSALLIAEVTAKAIEAIGTERAPESGIYHLAAAGATSWNGYARFAIADAMARGQKLRATPERVLPVPTTAFPTPAQRPLNSRLSTEKLRRALKIELPDWEDDVRLTLDALIAEPTP